MDGEVDKADWDYNVIFQNIWFWLFSFLLGDESDSDWHIKTEFYIFSI